MTNLSFYLFLISFLERVTELFPFLIFISIALIFILPAKGTKIFSHEHKPFSGVSRVLPWVILITTIVLFLVIPSEDTLYKVLLIEYGEDFIKSDDFRQMYEKSFNSLNSMLNKYNGVN